MILNYLDAGERISLLVVYVLLHVEESVVKDVAETAIALQVSQRNEPFRLRVDHVQHLYDERGRGRGVR